MFKPSCRILPLLLQCSMLRSHFQLLVILNLNLSFIGEPNFLPSILIFADLLQIYLIFMMISVIYTNNLEYRDYTLCLDSARHFIIFQSFTLIIHVANCLVEFNTVFFLVRNIICFFLHWFRQNSWVMLKSGTFLWLLLWQLYGWSYQVMELLP